MAGSFEVTTVVDRPIEEVFAYLAAGENDPRFSARVLEMRKATDGPVGVGTIFDSTVKDGGFKTRREFEITEFDAPTKIRWAERSKQPVVVPEGGYDLAAEGDGTRVRLHNVLEGRGLFGRLIEGPALKSARKGADAFGQAIKQAIEADG
jgi:uncharacterized protein YndB with AHSA1/START domain